LAGDWVAPNGTGQVSDLFFEVRRKIVSAREFSADLKISFPNKEDGILPISAIPETGSKLSLPRMAPEKDYFFERTWHFTNRERPETVQGYFFRTRTISDSNGNVKSALYGKIVGDFKLYAGTRSPQSGLGFTYYVNPNANSRNLEFDPTKNLIPNLKPSEQVKSP
jgi:hypothetical protein